MPAHGVPPLPFRCRFLARVRRAVVARGLGYSGDLVVRHRQPGQGLAPRRCVYCSASRVGAGAGRSARDPAVGRSRARGALRCLSGRAVPVRAGVNGQRRITRVRDAAIGFRASAVRTGPAGPDHPRRILGS